MKTYTIKSNRLSVELIDYGASIKTIKYIDLFNAEIFTSLHYNNESFYINDKNYLGKTVGRIANRVSNAKFRIDDNSFHLSKNLGKHQLHGGTKGLSERFWKLKEYNDKYVSFITTSCHLEDGYPGNIEIITTYAIINEDTLLISYNAVSDIKTPLSLTNHIYFNLNGDISSQIFNHLLQINSSQIIETNIEQLPTGKYLNIDNTEYDFKEFKPIKKESLLDHYWIFTNNDNSKIKLKSELTKIEVNIDTNYPGAQLYTGNFLNINNNRLIDHSGIAIECHEYPDFVNHSNFPQSFVSKGEDFSRYISFRFKKNG